MKFLGIFLVAICPIIVGFKKSYTLKQNQNKIEKIIDLINWIIYEIKYRKTETSTIFKDVINYEDFKNLEFLTTLKENLKNLPFPVAWENSIDCWECSISQNNKTLLKSLSNVLGTTESKGQILNLKQIKLKFEENLKYAKKIYIEKGKLSRSLGTLLGIAVFIIFI